MKKLISLLLVLCMVLGMSVSVWATETTATVSSDEELANAIADGKTELTLSAGTYHMPTAAKGKTLTITGASAESVIIEVVPAHPGVGEAGGQLDYNLDGSNVTFNNVTIRTNSQLYAGYARLSATYNNCVIRNTYNLGTGDSAFYNCTFYITNEYLRVGGASTAVFENCTFNTDGRAILVFQDGSSVAQTVTVKDCTFNATEAAYNWDKTIHISAVSIDGTNGTYVVNLEGVNTFDSDFNGLWQIKTGEANVTVNVIASTEPAPDDNTPSTPVDPPVEEDTTVEEDTYYEEIEEEDTHTSSSDMEEKIEDLSKNDDTVSIELYGDDDSIGYSALKLAAEEGLSVELDGTDDGYFWTFELGEDALKEFKGSFKSYVDVDAGVSTSMKKVLNDSDNYQIFKTEHEGKVPATTTLGVKLNKELRTADKLYLYYWNSAKKQVEEMNVTMYRDGNYLCMEIPHYSTYIITDAPISGAVVVEQGATVTAPVVSVDKANPETGASDFVGVAAALAVVSVLGGAALSLKK